MSDVKYVWFDWEDNTTSVNTINIIKEPKKPFDEYRIGEEIKTKLPNYGASLWNGVILKLAVFIYCYFLAISIVFSFKKINKFGIIHYCWKYH